MIFTIIANDNETMTMSMSECSALGGTRRAISLLRNIVFAQGLKAKNMPKAHIAHLSQICRNMTLETVVSSR